MPDPQGPAVTAAVTPEYINGVSKMAGADDWPAGESSALTLLDKFLDAAVENYARTEICPVYPAPANFRRTWLQEPCLPINACEKLTGETRNDLLAAT